ncbi:hypothetical protein [Acinetobacter sp. 226]|uniref:hypothetical protein n=1 Tax=unclassified Acinetobacter TaxID=196816 RepID=UPI003A8C81D5
MSIYCITYDLRLKSSRHYQQLLSFIRKNYEVIQHQKSVLIVSSLESAEAIRKGLLPFIDEKDKLEVFELNRSDIDKLVA